MCRYADTASVPDVSDALVFLPTHFFSVRPGHVKLGAGALIRNYDIPQIDVFSCGFLLQQGRNLSSICLH